ncbi:MAG: SIMPL domain-containing protein [Gemmatimonadaceae bacterium]
MAVAITPEIAKPEARGSMSHAKSAVQTPLRISKPVLIAAIATALAFVAFGAPRLLLGQAAVPSPPQIVVSANGEVRLAPDRANIQLGVETQAKTASVAAAENNRKQSAVLASIKALGIPSSAITTSNFSVTPIQRWDDKDKKTVIDGYQVTNLVVVVVSKLEQSGSVIDAALAAGANRVAGLTFELADPAKAREQAITNAVTQAKREASVAALAAGGSIGNLLEITINSFDQPRPTQMFAMTKMASDAVSTPVSEGTVTVQVSVTTRWLYGRN